MRERGPRSALVGVEEEEAGRCVNDYANFIWLGPILDAALLD